ncbi:NAD(+)/NADH kinase [Algoriphagus sp. H41]|uniref:NAD(+)/NADH kinase n=1 Tax=Algoriphagus oliviformis TaxID=2811231 RepID=A0ABS3C1S5_9BACT|nr:diacylglycerol kinase family protein [Algoriphagus oliviformis]MBN7811041.1 NAD(+)/NADH kinase [Algoriphagus oliviformis]
MKIILLYNPNAGTEDFDLAEVIGSLERQGARVVAQNTKEEGFEDIFKLNYDLVLIAGGDGTVEKILLELHDSKVPISLLPAGNANNIAGSLGIAGFYPDTVKNFQQENFQKLSVGVFETEGEKGRFIEGVGWGLFTALLQQIERGEKEESPNGDKVDFGSKHLRKLPKELPAQDYEIEIDGKDYSGSYLWIEVMNTRQLGPQLVLAKEADHSDEYLDVMLVKEEQLKELQDFLKAHEKEEVASPFETIKAKKVKVKTHLPFHVDDSVVEHKSLYEGTPQVKIKLQKHQLTLLNTDPKSFKKN